MLQTNKPIGARNYSIGTSHGKTLGNSLLQGMGAMPTKFYPSAHDSMFANARSVYRKDGGGGQNTFASSDYIYLKKLNTIGKSSYTKGAISFSGVNKNTVKSKLNYVRHAGSAAPAKKGLSKNQSMGRSTVTGSGGNRQVY
jgi:hypothetical protein